MMARICTNNLRVVLSPYVQHCQCEALEQKWDPKTKISSKEIEINFLFHSIPLDRLVHFSYLDFSVFVCQNWTKNGQVVTM